jgi:hypothetical protein
MLLPLVNAKTWWRTWSAGGIKLECGNKPGPMDWSAPDRGALRREEPALAAVWRLGPMQYISESYRISELDITQVSGII